MRGTWINLLGAILFTATTVVTGPPVTALAEPATAPAATNIAELKYCLKVMQTGGDGLYDYQIDHCIGDVLKFDQYCSKLGAYVGQEGGVGQFYCKGYPKPTTFWEDTEFLVTGIINGVFKAAVVSAPYIMTAVHTVLCIEGDILSCAIAADNILDMAGVDVPYGDALGLGIAAAECYEGNVNACMVLADSAGADKAPLVGAAYAKNKEKIKGAIYVAQCIDEQDTATCAQAIAIVGKEAGVDLPFDWATEMQALFLQCDKGQLLSCLKAAEKLGLPTDNVIGQAMDVWEKGAQANQKVQDCLVQGKLDACAAAATAVGANYDPFLPQAFIQQLEVALKACANGDAQACANAAKSLEVNGTKAVDAAKDKTDDQKIAVAWTDVPDEGTQNNRTAQQTRPSNQNLQPSTPAITVSNDNDDDDDDKKPNAQVTTATTTSNSVVPTGFRNQASYTGNCNSQRAGTICLTFPDGFVWIVTDSVLKWEDRPAVAGKALRVAVGGKADYQHLMGTTYIREVKK